MSVERVHLYQSAWREAEHPKRSLIDARGTFVSHAPAFIVPLTKAERIAFLSCLAKDAYKLYADEGQNSNIIKSDPIPSELNPLLNRMVTLGKSTSPDTLYGKVSSSWFVTEDTPINERPHPDSYPWLLFFSSDLPEECPTQFIRMTVAATPAGHSSGTLLYPGEYKKVEFKITKRDIADQAKTKQVITTPELTIIGFNGLDVHSSPLQKGVRALLTVTIFPVKS